MATISFALAAILGWPFAALLALPFVVEELFVKSGDEVVGDEIVFNWRVERVARLIKAVVCAAALAVSLVPVRADWHSHCVTDSRDRIRLVGVRQTDVPDA